MTQSKPPNLRVTSRTVGTAVVVEVAGEIDLLTAGDVQAAITAGVATAPETLVVDLTEVSFMDSAGLAMLAHGHMTAGEGVALRVVATNPATLKPIRLTGMDRMLAMFDTVADALAPDTAPAT
jgi:anti-sigma B factor antagonist